MAPQDCGCGSNSPPGGALRYSDRMRKSISPVETGWLELLEQAQEVFGVKLTRVILTGERPLAAETATDLANQSEADQATLKVALDIARSLLDLEATTTIQAWFVGKNVMLDDRPPALVVRTDPDAVRDAARHFAAYG